MKSSFTPSSSQGSQMSQQPPSAPDSPALVVTSNVQKYAIKKKKVLSAEETELFELTQAAGITVDQEVFKIIVDLLKMNVAPQAVFQTLKAMCAGQRVAESVGDTSTASHTTSITTAPTEAREEDSLVSGKSPKPPAAPPSASGPRATRVNTKIVVYGPQDASSPHSQGPLWSWEPLDDSALRCGLDGLDGATELSSQRKYSTAFIKTLP
ncbi:hypothetical protein L3Q82_002075 [Scortum barcoo]|uniref:Uncharacterized protein n=1 Tax=Scortum barcoo TaxID=214431 RepID=A0ACB8W1I3_9TELE|nr:hypothetical protein L3Q82_002075 [Scortum barcoo]